MAVATLTATAMLTTGPGAWAAPHPPTLATAGSTGCGHMWYVTNGGIGSTAPGTYGYVDPVTGTWTSVGTLADQSSAFAIDPANPTVAYYGGWNSSNATPNGILYRMDLTTGVSTQLNTTASPMFLANRMAIAADGTLWTMTSDGHLWSTTPTATGIGTPVDHGLVATPVNGPGGAPLTGGDIAFDGNGNLWIIASNSDLLTIHAADLGRTPPQATYVGSMGNQLYTGLAFTTDGTLYATSNSGALWKVNPATGATTQIADSGPASLGDLASCATPTPAATADLAVVKTAAPTADKGSTITWTIVVTNNGPDPALTWTMEDPIPAGVIGAATTTPNCAITGGTLVCSGTNLPAGDSVTITYTGTAPMTEGLLTNTATVSGSTTDPNPGNNTSSVDTMTIPIANAGVLASLGLLGAAGIGLRRRRRARTSQG